MGMSVLGIIGIAVAIIGVGVRLIIAFKPPNSERVKGTLGHLGYILLAMGCVILAILIWILYVPLTLQLPFRRRTEANPVANVVEAPTPGPAVNQDVASAPTPQAVWNVPASPQTGPTGPILAIEFVNTFNRLPKPCTIRITGPRNEFVSTISWLLANGGPNGTTICDLQKDESPTNASVPEPMKPAMEPGIVVHWNQDFKPGEDIVHYLTTATLNIRLSHSLPANSPANLIWLDIGPGSPWK
jgi:hypothetical protein